MNIALITAYFYPFSRGGTERYVYDLGISLQREGHRVCVICPAKERADFIHENLQVHAYEERNTMQFADTLKEHEIDIAHFHTLTPAIGTSHMELAASAGCRVFFTSHIPGNTCVRGDLLRYGKIPCDGRVRNQTCMSCYLHSKGLPRPLAWPAAMAIRVFGKPRPLADVVKAKKKQLKRLGNVCGRVFVFSGWQQRTFTLNNIWQTGVVPHAWTSEPDAHADFTAQKTSGHIRIGFAGRISPEKGLDLLINAISGLSPIKYSLDIAAVIVPGQKDFYEKLRRQTTRMANVTWRIDLDKTGMAEFFNRINLLCIPSKINETGPYVLYEALMAGKPVIASNLGSMGSWAAKGFPVTVFKNADVGSLVQALQNWRPLQENRRLPVPNSVDMTREVLRSYHSAR